MRKRVSFSGVMDRKARFVEKNQLMSKDDWMLFVHQFRRGTDTVDRGWRGEFWGKMMRGACMTYSYTKNERLYMLLTEVCEAMLKTQDKKGRFSTYNIVSEFKGWDIWSRKYVLVGFLHFYEICRDEDLKKRILDALEKHLDYIVDRVGYGNKTDLSVTSDMWGGINSASILEPVMKMYNLTGKESYIEFARYIIAFLMTSDVNIFTLALEDKLYPYEYPVTKAYEMMSCFEGLIEYYLVTGELKWKKAVLNFVNRVRESEITVIGGAGCKDELFNHSVVTQTDTEYKGVMQETCVTVTWMKLCNRLLTLTGEAKYADYIEESLYNSLYGAVNDELVDGFVFDSYSPLLLGKRGRLVGGYKNISDTRYYGCCAAIGAAGTALPLVTAAMKTGKGIAINYFESGTIEAEGFTIRVETDYPKKGKVKLTLEKVPRSEKSISFRIPHFATNGTKIKVCGERFVSDGEKTEGYYHTVTRKWNRLDVIELDLNMNLRTFKAAGVAGNEESSKYFAVLWGPLALARDKRVSLVGDRVEYSEKLKITFTEPEVNALLQAKVKIGNDEIKMIDYSSAGKTWNDKSLCEVFIKIS